MKKREKVTHNHITNDVIEKKIKKKQNESKMEE